MAELDSRLRALLDEAAVGDEPDGRDERGVRARLIASLAGAPGGAGLDAPDSFDVPQDGEAASISASGSETGAGTVALKWLALSAAIVGALSLLLVPPLQTETIPASTEAARRAHPTQAEAATRSEAPSISATAPPEPAGIPEMSKDTAEPLVEVTRASPAPHQVRSEPRREDHARERRARTAQNSVGPSELSLIRDATRALRDQEPDRALARLMLHAQRYPSGMLAEERAGLRAIALCAAGRLQEGRAARASFLEQFPRSPLSGRVRDACGGPSEPP